MDEADGSLNWLLYITVKGLLEIISRSTYNKLYDIRFIYFMHTFTASRTWMVAEDEIEAGLFRYESVCKSIVQRKI